MAEYCRDRQDCADVLEQVTPLLDAVDSTESDEMDGTVPGGFVYLLKSGRYYKVGRTSDVGRRRYDLAIQLPEPVTTVHEIATDDPMGIEGYWHTRFRDRRKNGEWFELTREDIAAFRRRRFM